MENVREGENESIDNETRARARASVAGLSKSKPSAGAAAVPGRGGPVEAGTLTKPPIITKEQMEKEGFTNLRDYLNFKGGFTRRPDKVNPDMGATSDKAFLDFVKDRNKPTPATASADVPVARSEVKNTSNDLRAKGQAQKDRGARLRGETDAVLGENAQKLKADFKRSLNVKDFLESSDYAKGGVVSASRRGDGIAQRGKTRGRMC